MSGADPPRRQRVRRGRAQAQRTYDRLAPVYDVLAGASERRGRRLGRRLVDVAPGERLLEIGCGTGMDLAYLAEQVGPNGWCLGVDLSTGMLRRTSRRLGRRGLADRTALTQADAVRLPLAPRCVDVVYLSFTLELFDTDELTAVLDGCRRVLRPTGRLGVVSLALPEEPPVMTRLYLRARKRAPSLLDCRPIPTEDLVRAAGFSVLRGRRTAVWGLPVDVVVAAPQRRAVAPPV